MEHTTATTLNLNTLHDEAAHLDVSSDNLVAHELVHHWWGDLITCKDWAEIWLNESFATYFATLWKEHDMGWDEAAWARHLEAESYLGEDARYRRPIATYRYPRPSAMFDRHSYPKGGRVLHMLRFVLGDEQFWRAVRHYCRKHAHSVVETADLRIAVAEATGQNLNWFFNQWIHSGGHPEFDVEYSWDAEAKTVRLHVRQTQKVTTLTPLFRTPLEIEIVTAEGSTTHKIEISKAEEHFQISSPVRPKFVLIDPKDWVLKKLTVSKSKQQWLRQLKDADSVVCRARAVENLKQWAAEARVRDALTAAARGDDFWAVRQTAAQALGELSGDDVRDTLTKVALKDANAKTRRAAVDSLEKFATDSVNATLRKVIAEDQSYFVVAAALRVLTKIDADEAEKDLLAALSRESHRQVILKAAADGLAKLKSKTADKTLLELLEPPASANRRIALLQAVAKLGQGKAGVVDRVSSHLNDERLAVRRAAIVAMAATGRPEAIDLLRDRRPKEARYAIVKEIDDAIKKLESGSDVSELQSRVRELEEDAELLRTRVKQLEDQSSP